MLLTGECGVVDRGLRCYAVDRGLRFVDRGMQCC